MTGPGAPIIRFLTHVHFLAQADDPTAFHQSFKSVIFIGVFFIAAIFVGIWWLRRS